MLAAAAIDVKRAAHDDSGARAAVARAMLNERGPVQRAADDYLDYVTYAPLSAQALRERHRAELAMGAVAGGDQPACSAPWSYRTTPLTLGVDLTESFSWLSTDLFLNFAGTLGSAAFTDAFGQCTFEAPFGGISPCPVLAVQAGDTPSYNEARRGADWAL